MDTARTPYRAYGAPPSGLLEWGGLAREPGLGAARHLRNDTSTQAPVVYAARSSQVKSYSPGKHEGSAQQGGKTQIKVTGRFD
jgi:hypothetical protein